MPKPANRPPVFNHVTDAAPEYVDEILWHRVVLAVAALALVVSGLGYGVFRLLGSEEQTTPAAAALALEELTLQEPPAAIPTPGATEVSEPIDVAATESADNNVSTSDAETTSSAQLASLDSLDTSPGTSPGSSADASVDRQLTAPIESTPSAQPASRDYRVETTIMVPTVKRALITDGMRGLEPGRSITDTQFLVGETQFSLYQYVDIRGHAGETLIHHWKRNGKTVAKVRIPVGSDKWRHHSSKNFTPRLQGDWQVDVTNQRGMLLVRSEFHLGE